MLSDSLNLRHFYVAIFEFMKNSRKSTATLFIRENYIHEVIIYYDIIILAYWLQATFYLSFKLGAEHFQCDILECIKI